MANGEVTIEALKNAVRVLENNLLYDPKMQREDSAVVDGFDIGLEGAEDEAEGEAEWRLLEEEAGANDEDYSEMKSRRSKWVSAIQSSTLLDRFLSATASPRTCMKRAAQSAQCRGCARRRASVAERTVWSLAEGGAAGGGSDASPPLFGGLDVLIEGTGDDESGEALDASVHHARLPRGG